MAAKVGTKYQMVIDREARARLGVEPGWQAVQFVEGDYLKIRFIPPEHHRSLAGSLSQYARGREPITDWTTAKQQAWESHVDAEWGPSKPPKKRK
jgi:hypothetical protein